jgi:hypothetical protein
MGDSARRAKLRPASPRALLRLLKPLHQRQGLTAPWRGVQNIYLRLLRIRPTSFYFFQIEIGCLGTCLIVNNLRSKLFPMVDVDTFFRKFARTFFNVRPQSSFHSFNNGIYFILNKCLVFYLLPVRSGPNGNLSYI